jgi:hypothetical protein
VVLKLAATNVEVDHVCVFEMNGECSVLLAGRRLFSRDELDRTLEQLLASQVVRSPFLCDLCASVASLPLTAL